MMSEDLAKALLAYTCGEQKSKEPAKTLLAYTCGEQKSKGRT